MTAGGWQAGGGLRPGCEHRPCPPPRTKEQRRLVRPMFICVFVFCLMFLPVVIIIILTYISYIYIYIVSIYISFSLSLYIYIYMNIYVLCCLSFNYFVSSGLKYTSSSIFRRNSASE